MIPLLPVAEAQARLLALAAPLPPEDAAPHQWVGRWTGSPVVALRSQPDRDLSAMDGYAIRFADASGPWTVIGESAAGTGFDGAVTPGTAVRIFTGAPLPPGADTVIMQEEVTRDGARLHRHGAAPASRGQFVRPRGSDFAQNTPLIPAGTRLTARHVALAILGGHGRLSLPRRPRVSLLSNGAELVAPGGAVAPGRLPASNAAMLAAMLAPLPVAVRDRGIVGDDRDALARALAGAAEDDIIVSTGGASVGDHDLMRPALEAAGGEIAFWRIRMRPGKPLICGRLGGALFLGLPGNPVSACVTAHLFLLPLVRALAGCPAPLPAVRRAVLAAALPPVGGRDDYARAILDTATEDAQPSGTAADAPRVQALAQQDSAATFALAQADGLIRRPAESPALPAGASVDFLPFAP